MKLISAGFTALLIAVTVYLYGNLIYMNLRPADPILPGWEEFDAAAFARYQASGDPLLVEIYASWCPTCKAQHEAFEQIEESGRRPAIRAIRVDFDRDADFRKSLGINYTGALLIFQGEQRITEGDGLVTPDSILQFLGNNGITAQPAQS